MGGTSEAFECSSVSSANESVDAGGSVSFGHSHHGSTKTSGKYGRFAYGGSGLEEADEVVIEGPTKVDIPKNLHVTYVREGMLCWPKLESQWFLPPLQPARSSTQSIAPVAATASTSMNNFSDLLIRDEYQLEDRARRPGLKWELDQELRALSAGTAQDRDRAVAKVFASKARELAQDVYGAWFLCMPSYTETSLFPKRVSRVT